MNYASTTLGVQSSREITSGGTRIKKLNTTCRREMHVTQAYIQQTVAVYYIFLRFTFFGNVFLLFFHQYTVVPNLKIRIYKHVIFPLVLYWYQIGSDIKI
jgi:hypothetical protein